MLKRKLLNLRNRITAENVDDFVNWIWIILVGGVIIGQVITYVR